MKPLVVCAFACAILANAATVAAQPLPEGDPSEQVAPGSVSPPALSPNDAAGLPNLEALNRPAASASAKIELNAPRAPSFYHRDGNGTEIEEYRDRGKATEIDVRSNFGTHYQMSSPGDVSPQIQNSGPPVTRLPSIQLKY